MTLNAVIFIPKHTNFENFIEPAPKRIFFSFEFLSQSGNHFLRQLLQQTKNNFVEKSVEREQNVSNVVGGVNMRVSMIVQNILMPQYFFSRQDVRLIYFVCSSSFSRILLAAV